MDSPSKMALSKLLRANICPFRKNIILCPLRELRNKYDSNAKIDEFFKNKTEAEIDAINKKHDDCGNS